MALRHFAIPAALAASAAAGAALACSCVGYADAGSQLAEARLMIVARAEWTRPERGAGEPGRKVTRFQVVRTIKGERRQAWRIAHPIDGAACGVAFRPGRQYVVIATAWEGRITTGLCQRAQFPMAEYEAAALRSSGRPVAD